VGTGKTGGVVTTDNDNIEVSNLNRQFLFRQHNVGMPKTVAASEAVKAMNEKMKVRVVDCFLFLEAQSSPLLSCSLEQINALQLLVAPHTEATFNQRFWSSLDVVATALDNVKVCLFLWLSHCMFSC
jgi:ubiquitin-activating enzyme E1